MQRVTYMAYGIGAYLVFQLTFLYLIGFVADAPFLPLTINRGGAEAPVLVAALVDLGLIALFGVQHSVMARPAFKARMAAMIPAPIERSTYVLATCAVLIVLYLGWMPLPAIVWTITSSVMVTILWGLFAIGWAVVLISTFLISHFQLFGLAQVHAHFTGKALPEKPLSTPLFYRAVRHPLYLGFLMAFWAIPVMTAGHLLFALAMTGYILIAIRYEERDLVAHFGDGYAEYRKKVGMLLPRLR